MKTTKTMIKKDLSNYNLSELNLLSNYFNIDTNQPLDLLIDTLSNVIQTRYLSYNMEYVCSEDVEPIYQMEWDDTIRPEIKILFVDTKTNNTECYTLDNWIQYTSMKDNFFSNWVAKSPDGVIDDEGYGGEPGNEILLKTPMNRYVVGFSNINLDVPGEYIAIPILENYRIGNTKGIFGISSLHGQAPGHTVYCIVSPNELYKYTVKTDDKTYYDFLEDKGDDDSFYNENEIGTAENQVVFNQNNESQVTESYEELPDPIQYEEDNYLLERDVQRDYIKILIQTKNNDSFFEISIYDIFVHLDLTRCSMLMKDSVKLSIQTQFSNTVVNIKDLYSLYNQEKIMVDIFNSQDNPTLLDVRTFLNYDDTKPIEIQLLNILLVNPVDVDLTNEYVTVIKMENTVNTTQQETEMLSRYFPNAQINTF